MSWTFFLGAAVSFFFAWIVGYMHRHDARIRAERFRAIQLGSVDQIREPGLVAIRGEVLAPETSPPIPGEPELGFDGRIAHIEIEARRDSPPAGQRGAAVDDLRRFGETLTLEDDTGRAVVEAASAQLSLEAERIITVNRPDYDDLRYLHACGLVNPTTEAAKTALSDRDVFADLNALRRAELAEGWSIDYRAILVGDELTCVGDARLEDGVPRFATTARIQIELASESLEAIKASHESALGRMQTLTRAFIGLGVGLLVVGVGLVLAG